MIFENFPEHSRIWIYGFNEALDNDQQKLVNQKLTDFKNNWLYHGKSVQGDFTVLEKQFAVLVTDDQISGCSIDSSVAVFKELKNNYNLDALDQNLIFYRSDYGIKAVSRSEFKNLCDQDKISSDTIVFNLMITSLADFRNRKFELKFSESWHSKLFKLPDMNPA